ncbi:MAG: hypothetical protein ACK5BQ_00715 [Ignavibacteria bacterium]|jgi:hypothetical protein
MNSIEAKTIEDRAIVPLASFLHDCLIEIDPHYMENIVERFIKTKDIKDKGYQPYKGVIDIFDDRGMRRTSLEQFDLLFLLQFFAFVTTFNQKTNPDQDWFPNLTKTFRFSKNVRNKIVVLKDKRNTTEHNRTERERHHYLEILVSNFLDVFAHEIMVVIEQQPECFSERTKRENREFVEYLKQVKHELTQPRTRRSIMALVLVIVIAALAAAYLITRPEPIPKKGFVFIACNGLEQLTTQQLVEEVSKQCGKEEVIAVDVVSGSGILWSKPVQSTRPDSLAQLMELVRSRSERMTDITQFAASFDAAFLAMNKMYDHSRAPRMVMLGHLPEITIERNEQLRNSGWQPSRIDRFISTWSNRKYHQPLWIYSGTKHQAERDYVDNILIKSDSILRPEERQL